MPDQDAWTTWDGEPVSQEPPHGATIVVYRRVGSGYQFLLLHRAHSGPDYEGEWAWTPPAGARHPREPVDECAVRELKEETGLSLTPTRTSFGAEDWHLYAAEASLDDSVVLDAEHDRFEWLPVEIAVARCLPKRVGDFVEAVGMSLGLR